MSVERRWLHARIFTPMSWDHVLVDAGGPVIDALLREGGRGARGDGRGGTAVLCIEHDCPCLASHLAEHVSAERVESGARGARGDLGWGRQG